MNQMYKVVVAEDEELQLGSLVRKIHYADLGFNVVGTALNGKQALELIEKDKPDVLITDIQMPVMTGLKLIENLHHSYPDIAVIITSGFSDFDFAKKAMQFGVMDYLLKPVDYNELFSTLQNLQERFIAERSDKMDLLTSTSLKIVSKDEAVLLLHEHISNNYTTEINLNKIADSIHYSPGYLTKLFIQKYDMAPNKYIIHLRIQRAKALLAVQPPLSVKQIGEEVGYPEQGYFSRIFKKITGLSPLDYRVTCE